MSMTPLRTTSIDPNTIGVPGRLVRPPGATMTDLAPYVPQPASTLELAPQVWQLAERICQTDFVPKALRGNAPAVMACMLAGNEAGISPMQSLAKIHIIDGRPAMAAELMRALVLRHGHELWYPEISSERVTAKGRRRGSDRDPTTITWTKDDAQRAGLLQKDVWRKYPQAMLLARATGMLCRLEFADVLAGISYTPEEISGGLDTAEELTAAPAVVDAEQTEAPPGTRRRRASRTVARADQPADAPAAIETTAGEIPDLPEPGATSPQDDSTPTTAAETPPSPPTPQGAANPADSAAPADVDDDWPSADWPSADYGTPTEPPNTERRLTGPQMIAMRLGERFGIGKGSTAEHRAERLEAIRYLVGRPNLESSKELTPGEIEYVLQTLDAWPEGDDLYAGRDTPPAEPAPEPPPPAPVAPAPRPTPAPSRNPESWTDEDWRGFLTSRKVKVSELLRQAQALAGALNPPQSIAVLQDLTGSGVCNELVGWAEDLAMERRGS